MAKKYSDVRFFQRLYNAFKYSFQGIGYAFSNEAAFRQEVVIYFITTPLIFILPIPHWLMALLFVSNSMVLMVELVNSAIESVVDMVTEEYHILAKRAKDMGSAAVFVALMITCVLWGVALYMSFL